MKLKLVRTDLADTHTGGKLYIDGVYFCDTLEDKVRDLSKEAKVMHETAIPYGIYKITLDVVSPRFGTKSAYQFCNGKLPRLIDVPRFEGVLIHIGNFAKDSSGCVLVGENYKNGAISNSTSTFKKLYEKLLTDKNNLTIEIL